MVGQWAVLVGRGLPHQGHADFFFFFFFSFFFSWTSAWTLGLAHVRGFSRINQFFPNSSIFILPKNHINYALFTHKYIFQKLKSR